MHAWCCGREDRAGGIPAPVTPEIRRQQKTQRDQGRNSEWGRLHPKKDVYLVRGEPGQHTPAQD